ncbi:MAG: hypothetical protein ACI841_000919, partial [Planctomycetota bacterium]
DQDTVPDAGKLIGDTERQYRSSRTEYRLVLKLMDIQRGTIQWTGTYDLDKRI